MDETIVNSFVEEDGKQCSVAYRIVCFVCLCAASHLVSSGCTTLLSGRLSETIGCFVFLCGVAIMNFIYLIENKNSLSRAQILLHPSL